MNFLLSTKEEWERVIEEDLKGEDYKQKLKWETGEGIEALPFYRQEDMKDLEHTHPIPHPDKEKNEWQICQPIFEQDVSEANKAARSAVESGAEALKFEFNLMRTEGGLGGDLKGTAIQNQEDFSTLFEGIDIADMPLKFDSGLGTLLLLAMLQNEIENREIEPASVDAAFMYDPYAYMARKGQLPKLEQDFLDESVQMVSYCSRHLKGVRCLGVDGRLWHNAGASIVEELALALATGSEYLAKLSERELSIDEIASHIHFSFAIGSNYFLEIAKFRAFRILWEKVVKAYEPEKESSTLAYVHGETSRWNKPIYDPYTNMLRTTTEGMSAAIAGCDSISINPFNLSGQTPDEFGQRIARNTQIIFKEEAYLNQVHDPAAGSYYMEKLTDKIAAASWEIFQELEKQGGIFKAITNGTVATMIEESVQKHDQAIAERGRIFVGTNQYPNEEDKMAEKIKQAHSTVSLNESDLDVEIDKRMIVESVAKAFRNGAELGDLVPGLFDHGKQLFRAIYPYRGTEAFEKLRLATEQHVTTPTVLILPLGDRKMSKARSTFASNFFGCAGYEIKEPIGFQSMDEAVDKIIEVDPEIVVLCSSDQEYEGLVKALCTKLDQLDNKPIAVLASYPKDQVEFYKELGIDAFIHRKSNVLETLKEFHQKLKIEID
ncbi:MAG: methylmalonyl-CoA mutase family protein [Balneolaceae bacterium]|nr:methylmalonyl-CoA mutase family protein [Balneolaceae bacterium]